MKRIGKTSLSVLLALSLLWPTHSAARAEEYDCQDESLGAVTVDNLRVPQDASCTLDGTTVEGTIKVEDGASLTATQVSVIGNVQAEGAAAVNVLAGSVISGSIQIKQGVAAQIDQVHVNGDIQFESNTGALSATGNQVGGNVQVFQNTGGVTITDNTIDGNLQCKENDPPFISENNVVHGNKEDQCAAPKTKIDSGPPATTTSTSAVFTFSADVPGATFECGLDGAAFAACVSPVELTGLAVGEHVFRVRATDPSGNVEPTPASHTWTVASLMPFRVFLPAVLKPPPGTTSLGRGAPTTIFAGADSQTDQNSASHNSGADASLRIRSLRPGGNFRALDWSASRCQPACRRAV
jgi:hypothetical protein